MEVHAHAHTAADADSHRSRKKWTHYFWEFVMLFLAVFCGFLAENFREHKVEHKREKQFIRSLIRDVEMDTARLYAIVDNRDERMVNLDSLIDLLNRPDAAAYSRYIYHHNSYATRMTFRFYSNDGTMLQLKNAGNLRLIRKQQVSDSIMSYDLASRLMVQSGNWEEEMMETYRVLAAEIFNGIELEKTRDEDNNVIRLDYDPPLNDNKEAVFKLTYRVHMLKNFNRSNRKANRELLQKAMNLITLLKKEYHLK